MQEIIIHNLVSPAVCFFVLGLVAALFKSDLKFPPALSESLSIYLLVAIGLKGGIELTNHSLGTLIAPITGTLLLGLLIPLLTFAVCRWVKLDRKNTAALAATYGSVSVVTFGAATAFLQQASIPFESYMSAMLVLLESPAILLSLLMLAWLETRPATQGKTLPGYTMGIVMRQQKGSDRGMSQVVKESLLGKSILLLLGAMGVGLIAGQQALPTVEPLFIDLFPSVLVIFLLGMGLAAGERLPEMKKHGFKLVGLAILFPLLYGMLGVLVGYAFGLSPGGTALMGVLGASSSYIAAPAALRHSVPEASPSIYLGMSLGITFPFNLIIGIPLYVQFAQWLHL